MATLPGKLPNEGYLAHPLSLASGARKPRQGMTCDYLDVRQSLSVAHRQSATNIFSCFLVAHGEQHATQARMTRHLCKRFPHLHLLDTILTYPCCLCFAHTLDSLEPGCANVGVLAHPSHSQVREASATSSSSRCTLHRSSVPPPCATDPSDDDGDGGGPNVACL